MKTPPRLTLVLLALIEVYLLSACGSTQPQNIARELLARELSFTGVVQEKIEDQWVVSGQTVVVSRSTFMDSHVVIGNIVEVQGMVLDDGTVVATNIELVKWMTALPTAAAAMLAFLLLLIPVATTALKQHP